MLVVDDRVNLYQTSSSGVPVQVPMGIPELGLACLTEPPVLVTPNVKTTAPEQSSFVGPGRGVPANTNWKEKTNRKKITIVRAVVCDMALKGFG